MARWRWTLHVDHVKDGNFKVSMYGLNYAQLTHDGTFAISFVA